MNSKIEKLIKQFAKLPRVGNRAAVRIVLSILQTRDGRAENLAAAILDATENVVPCPVCGTLTDKNAGTCEFCRDTSRINGQICIVRDMGDVWTLGRHRLVCGDSTKAETFNLLMAGAKANLIITDPPYNVNYEGSAGKIQNDNMGNEAFYEFLLAAFQNIAAIMANDASIYVFHADTEGLNFRRAFADAGFYLSGCCIWKKQSLVLGRSPYQWQHEPVLYGWKKGGKHQWYAGRKETTIWEYDKPKKNADHPTMKPITLCAKLIYNSSHEDDMVFEPFGGSGSTLIAADQLNRKCCAIELEPKYCDVIIRRWQQHDVASGNSLREGRKVIHAATGKTFEEISAERLAA